MKDQQPRYISQRVKCVGETEKKNTVITPQLYSDPRILYSAKLLLMGE